MEKEKRSKKMVILEMIVRGSGMYSKCDTIDEMIEVLTKEEYSLFF